MKKSKLFRMVYGLGIALIVSLIAALGGQNAMAQEIPNGDGDLLWERPLNGRTVNDAKFHPINGNIIAAVNHEIWEIDPKDGHTIRVFEGSGQSEIKYFQISNDGKYLVSGGAEKWIIIWDYQTGTILKILDNIKQIPVYNSIGIYPDSKSFVYFSFEIINNTQYSYVKGSFNIYNFEQNKIIKTVETPSQISYNKAVDAMQLSIDGKLFAIGFRNREYGVFKDFTMELWDAETLTKIQDLGNFKVGDFRDIQFSNDNQYIGYGFSPGLILYKKNNEQYNKYPVVTYPISFSIDAFCFSINNKLFLNTFKEDINYDATYIINLNNLDSIYKYPHCGYPILRTNTNNELFTIGFDTIVGVKIQFYSNKWYEVSVQNPIEIKIGITKTTYTNNSIQLTTKGIDIIKTLLITDTLGKKIYVQNDITVINNSTEIPHFLSSGNYLLKIVSNGKEYTSKFIVTR
ncbi:MAG: hypothetical protein A2X64_08880 [Ignavibacteria bacterium GWF2_33_9]|nr:MAG: hypothetical protein A2X64_08880 [Ignavibacteria bacterium GWF2_33_9]